MPSSQSKAIIDFLFIGRSNFRTDLLRICVVWYAERNRQPCITAWIISDINLLNCNFGEILKLSSRQCPPIVYHYTLHNTLASTLCQCRDNFHVILDRMQVGVGWKPHVNSRFRTNWQWDSYNVSTVRKKWGNIPLYLHHMTLQDTVTIYRPQSFHTINSCNR